jgi:hypothetical protein
MRECSDVLMECKRSALPEVPIQVELTEVPIASFCEFPRPSPPATIRDLQAGNMEF